ncbi:30S ribosomal protein S16 [Vulcanococcus sp.]|jgi:small subunit ribosomal protein S16|uniref:30S ribosomal protein S16 n=1 Tax=Vulcanococcus sp. TaxID=2856995 RepID=UPI0034F169E8
MIKLRLKRFGKKREASFRLVACNSTSRRDGRPLEELGFYNPRTKETRLNTEAIRARLAQGAQPTDTVLTLLERGGLLEKSVRASVVVGQKKQTAIREAAAKQAAKEAAEAKAAEAAAAAEAKAAEAAAAAAAAEAPADDAASEATEA